METLRETEVLLNQSEAARRLNVSPRTLEGWRLRGGGPLYSVLGGKRGRIRYRPSALDDWLKKNERHSTSEYGGK
jgi:hypothetical protein